MPTWIEGVEGLTDIDTSDAGGAAVTVSVVVPLIPPVTAWIVVVPADTAVASPAEAIVAVAILDEDQLAVLVKSFVLLSLKEPVAVNC